MVAVYASSIQLAATDKPAENIVDMLPKESFIGASAVDDKYGANDKGFIHAGQRSCRIGGLPITIPLRR